MREAAREAQLTAHRGPGNALLKAVETEWLVCLDDDDLLQPTYIAEVTQRLENADVVYTWLSISDEKLGRIDATGWLSERVAAELREHNFIAACAAVRTEVLRAIGGWKILGGSTGRRTGLRGYGSRTPELASPVCRRCSTATEGTAGTRLRRSG